ncbi:MAG: hypothetical protein RDV48_24135 [Candidatus Eremiobacteraeota bacterium]|nr:hypothetical protein [Candidatus Eremiobacteraeota bacterium]
MPEALTIPPVPFERVPELTTDCRLFTILFSRDVFVHDRTDVFLHIIEKTGDILCYGNPQPEEMLREQIERVKEIEALTGEAHAGEP